MYSIGLVKWIRVRVTERGFSVTDFWFFWAGSLVTLIMALKSKSTSVEKPEKILKVANEVIKVLSGGTSRLNISDIAKSCDVSRSWIYKNFGDSNISITKSAIDVLAPMLTQRVTSFSDWREGRGQDWLKLFSQGLEKTLRQVYEHPHLFRFYLRVRLEESELSAILSDHEQKFIQQIIRPQFDQQTNVQVSISMAQLLLSIRIGFIFKWLTSMEGSSIEKDQVELQMGIKAIGLAFGVASA